MIMGKTCEGKEMTKQGRVFVFMMDSFGIGGAPDAGKYANEGANTLGHIAAVNMGLKIPNLLALGLGDAAKGASRRFSGCRCSASGGAAAGVKIWACPGSQRRQRYGFRTLGNGRAA